MKSRRLCSLKFDNCFILTLFTKMSCLAEHYSCLEIFQLYVNSSKKYNKIFFSHNSYSNRPGTSLWLTVLYFLLIPNRLSRSILNCIANSIIDSSISSNSIFMGPACQVISPSFIADSNSDLFWASGHWKKKNKMFLLSTEIFVN